MSSLAYSNILQNDTEILEKQWQEMQQRHEKKQWLLVQLEEAAKLCWYYELKILELIKKRNLV